MSVSFIALLAGLVSVVNPFSAMPVFLALTKDEGKKQRNLIALKCSFFFALILLVFYFSGPYILNFFHITVDALRIAGGVIIFGSGTALLRGKFAKNSSVNRKVTKEAAKKEDISLSPLAMPMLSGPGSISYLISIRTENKSWVDYWQMVAVIFLAALITYLVFRVSTKVTRFLGEAGMNSISRILGFIVMSIGVQYIITGVKAALHF